MHNDRRDGHVADILARKSGARWAEREERRKLDTLPIGQSDWYKQQPAT